MYYLGIWIFFLSIETGNADQIFFLFCLLVKQQDSAAATYNFAGYFTYYAEGSKIRRILTKNQCFSVKWNNNLVTSKEK